MFHSELLRLSQDSLGPALPAWADTPDVGRQGDIREHQQVTLTSCRGRNISACSASHQSLGTRLLHAELNPILLMSMNRATLNGRKVAVKFVGKEASSGPKVR